MQLPFQFFEAVAQAALSKDVLRVSGVFFNFLAQIGDVEAQVVSLVTILASPNFGEERFVGQEASSITDEVVEQAILGRTQDDFLTTDDDFPFGEVDFEVRVYDNFGLASWCGHEGATQQGANT